MTTFVQIKWYASYIDIHNIICYKFCQQILLRLGGCMMFHILLQKIFHNIDGDLRLPISVKVRKAILNHGFISNEENISSQNLLPNLGSQLKIFVFGIFG